jgi:hypothetical protein
MSLESLILHPKIWRGMGCGYKQDAIETGFIDLDRRLPGGGWPQKSITEVFVERYGIGELSLLMPACASQQSVVWIAPPYIPYAPALAGCGLSLERILLVHPSGPESNTLWATEQVLRSKPKIAVLAWLKSVTDAEFRRLQLTLEEQGSWAVFFRPMKALQQRSPAALRLRLSKKIGVEACDGFRIEILKCRGGAPSTVILDTFSLPKQFDSGETGWR